MAELRLRWFLAGLSRACGRRGRGSAGGGGTEARQCWVLWKNSADSED